MWPIISPKKRAPRNAKNRGKTGHYPMDIGDEYEVEIFDIAPNGEGVAKIKNYPVFIKNAKLKERIKIRITSLNAGSADAEIAAYTSGTTRIFPPIVYFGMLGSKYLKLTAAVLKRL